MDVPHDHQLFYQQLLTWQYSPHCKTYENLMCCVSLLTKAVCDIVNKLCQYNGHDMYLINNMF